MNEKWNEFVYELIDALRRNVEEDEYHVLIENQLKLLGWLKSKGEICHKPNVPIGNSKHIQPDILIKRDDEEQFVIEVKRPVHTLSERERQQLESYMRQLKLKVGVYIGEHIEIFYDKPDSKNAVSVLNVPLEMDNKRGARFVELFIKDSFNKTTIAEYCENRIKEMQRQESLNKIKENLIVEAQIQITESLKPYLMEKYGLSFTETDIDNMLASLCFTASSKDSVLVEETSARQPQHQEEKKPVETSKRVYDNTNYSLNGGPKLKKNSLVYAVVSTYLKEHSTMTFAKLEGIFKPELQGPYGVIRTVDYIREKNYSGRRYFDEEDNVLVSGDRVSFAVSTQWGKGNLPAFIEVAKSLGYDVRSTSDENVKTFENKENNGEFVNCLLTRGGIDAQGLFDVTNESLTVLKGSRINPNYSNSFKPYEIEKRKKQIADYTEERDGLLYMKEDLKFDSPSGASVFCVGSSSNGWRDWRDEKNNMLQVYRKG